MIRTKTKEYREKYENWPEYRRKSASDAESIPPSEAKSATKSTPPTETKKLSPRHSLPLLDMSRLPKSEVKIEFPQPHSAPIDSKFLKKLSLLNTRKNTSAAPILTKSYKRPKNFRPSS